MLASALLWIAFNPRPVAGLAQVQGTNLADFPTYLTFYPQTRDNTWDCNTDEYRRLRNNVYSCFAVRLGDGSEVVLLVFDHPITNWKTLWIEDPTASEVSKFKLAQAQDLRSDRYDGEFVIPKEIAEKYSTLRLEATTY